MTRNEAIIIKHLAEENYRKDEKLKRVYSVIKQEYKDTFSAYHAELKNQYYTGKALKYKHQLDELQIIALKLGMIEKSIHELNW